MKREMKIEIMPMQPMKPQTLGERIDYQEERGMSYARREELMRRDMNRDARNPQAGCCHGKK